MSDEFQSLVTEAQGFFTELAQNNDRDWFEARKAHYKSRIEAPARLAVTLFEQDLSRLTGLSHTGKLGRIYRDTRFSNDKSPYNIYLHGYWGHAAIPTSGWLFRITADGCDYVTGLHDLDTPALGRFRAAVDRTGDALETAIAAGRAAGCDLVAMGPEPLKRVPQPYDAAHPHADHLRRKGIVLGGRLGAADLAGGLLPALAARTQALLPFWHWCRAAMT